MGGRAKDYDKNLPRSKLVKRDLKQLTDCKAVIQRIPDSYNMVPEETEITNRCTM